MGPSRGVPAAASEALWGGSGGGRGGEAPAGRAPALPALTVRRASGTGGGRGLCGLASPLLKRASVSFNVMSAFSFK